MADDVEITIGVALDKMASGIDSAKSTLEDFKTGMEGLLSALAVEKIASFVEKMAEMGEQIERTSAILGISTTQAQQLGQVAQLAGGSAEAMTMSIERMQLNLQRATTATSAQAQALSVMGLNAKSLIGLSIDQQVNKIADAVSKFADGGTKSAAVMELLGRGGMQMIPFLDEGAKGMDELRQKMSDAGTVMSQQTVESLSRLEKQLTLSKAAMTSLGGAIVAVTSSLTGGFIAGLTQSMGSLSQMIQTGNVANVMFAYMDSFLDNLTAKLRVVGVALVDLFTFNFSNMKADIDAAITEVGTVQQRTSAMIKSVFADVKADYDGLIKHIESSSLPQMNAMDFGASQRMKEAMAEAQAEIRDNQLVFDDTKEKLDAAAKMMEITETQKTAALRSAIQQRLDMDMDALDDAESVMAKGSAEWQKAEQLRVQITLKANNEISKANHQLLESYAADVKGFADQISSAIDGQLKNMLSGAETWSQGMKAIFADLTLKIIEDLIKIAVEKAALGIFNLVTGGIGGTLAGGILGAVQSGFGTTWSGESHQTGTSYVPQTGLAMLHQGEAVIPAEMNTLGANPNLGGGGAGGGVTFNVSAVDAQSFASALMGNRGALQRVLMTVLRQNPSLLMNAASKV